MVEINPSEFPILVEAISLWTGWRKSISPRRDDSAVINHFGSEVASKLLSELRALKKEFYMSDACLAAGNPSEMFKMALEHFKEKHPEMPDEIGQAFAWCYTFDYR
jgi:hypothetical protein